MPSDSQLSPAPVANGSSPALAGKKSPPLHLAWLIWGIGALFYLSGYYLRVSPAVMTTELMRSFQTNAAGLGTLSGIFFYLYVIMQVPTGVLVDSWGPRKLLTWAGLLAAAGTFLFGATSNFDLACAGRAIVGGATAVEWLVLLKIGAHWFPRRRFSMLAGLGLFFGNIGALTAQVPLRLMIVHFGWRAVIIGSGAVVLLFAALAWAFVKDDPSDAGFATYASTAAEQSGKVKAADLWKGFLKIFGYRNTWLIFFAQGGFVGPMIAFTGLWAVPFLTVRFGLKPTIAAAVSSVMIICWAVASPICGDLSDRIGRRKPIYLAGGLISTVGWFVMFFVNGLPLAAFIPIAAITSFSCGAVILGFAYCRESVPTQYSGASNATVNIGNMVGAAILEPAIGWVLDKEWSGKIAGGVHVYGLHAYQMGLLLIVGWSAIALVLLTFTKETYCKQQVP
ncbi:MAG TPA: MFS transporter [Candidatus Aquilonibacter sp.]|nr:MFS transporter [Candidatus Aquilonibacter sp.]